LNHLCTFIDHRPTTYYSSSTTSTLSYLVFQQNCDLGSVQISAESQIPDDNISNKRWFFAQKLLNPFLSTNRRADWNHVYYSFQINQEFFGAQFHGWLCRKAQNRQNERRVDFFQETRRVRKQSWWLNQLKCGTPNILNVSGNLRRVQTRDFWSSWLINSKCVSTIYGGALVAAAVPRHAALRHWRDAPRLAGAAPYFQRLNSFHVSFFVGSVLFMRQSRMGSSSGLPEGRGKSGYGRGEGARAPRYRKITSLCVSLIFPWEIFARRSSNLSKFRRTHFIIHKLAP